MTIKTKVCVVVRIVLFNVFFRKLGLEKLYLVFHKYRHPHPTLVSEIFNRKNCWISGCFYGSIHIATETFPSMSNSTPSSTEAKLEKGRHSVVWLIKHTTG